MQGKPLIVDTDIGLDVDDAFALVYLLCRQAPISLIHVSHHNTREKAAIVAKILQAAGREDIPVSIGPATSEQQTRLHGWIADFDFKSYRGNIHSDGMPVLRQALDGRLADVLGLSPATSLGLLAESGADLSRVQLTYMAGSLRHGYDGDPNPCVEWNVRNDIAGFQKVLAANWRLTLVPLDACANAVLHGKIFEEIEASKSWAARTVFDCYRHWNSGRSRLHLRESSTLFDVVAADIWLEQAQAPEKFHLQADDSGLLVLEGGARPVACFTHYDAQGAIARLAENLLRG